MLAQLRRGAKGRFANEQGKDHRRNGARARAEISGLEPPALKVFVFGLGALVSVMLAMMLTLAVTTIGA